MKKSNYLLLFIFFVTLNFIQAQENKDSKFNIIVYGGIGHLIVENENEPNYNLYSNSGEILLNYRITQKFGVATGIGLNQLSGNGFNSLGNFYHKRTLIKIPLLATWNYNVSDELKLLVNFGFYTQNISKDEYRFLNKTQKNIYDGWNFGGQFGLGFVYKIFDNYNLGINYSAQSDFISFKTSNNQTINDEQKLKNLNSIGILLMFEL